MFTFDDLAKLLKMEPAVLHKTLCNCYNITYEAVLKWRLGKIPPKRQIQIVSDFNLDPNLLIKKIGN